MIPPPFFELFKNSVESPNNLAHMSTVTCSSSVQAGEHIHWPVISVRPITHPYIETWVGHGASVHLPYHALECRYRGEVSRKLWMLPMRYAYLRVSHVYTPTWPARKTWYDHLIEILRYHGEILAVFRHFIYSATRQLQLNPTLSHT